MERREREREREREKEREREREGKKHRARNDRERFNACTERDEDATVQPARTNGIGLMNVDFVPRQATGIDSRKFVSESRY